MNVEKLFRAFITVIITVGTLVGLLAGVLLLVSSAYMLFVEHSIKNTIICFLSSLIIGTILVYFWEDVI